MAFPNNDKISVSQLRNILVMAMAGVGVLGLPRILSEEAGTDGWLLLICVGICAIILSYIYGYIIQCFPGMTWFDILAINLSRPMAYIVTAYFLVHFVIIGGYVTRIFIAVVKMMLLLRNTPRGILLLSFLLVVGYMGRKGIEPMGRFSEIVAIPLLLSTLGIFMASIIDIKFINFLPVLQTDFIDIIKGIPSTALSFLGMEIILIFGVFLNEPKESAKTSATAAFIVLIIYLILDACVLGILGDQQIRYMVWPSITALENVHVGGGFIENIAVLLMGLWVIVSFTTIAPMHLSASIMISNIFNTDEYNYFGLPLLPFLYMTSRWSDSIADVYKNLKKINLYTSLGVLIIVPFLLIIVMTIRKTHKVSKKEI